MGIGYDRRVLKPRRATGGLQLALALALTLPFAVLFGYVVGRVPEGTFSAAPHFLLIALLGGAAVATVVWAARSEELLGPLGILALTMIAYFVVRPLQLALASDELQHVSYDYFAGVLDTVQKLTAQEITLYVQTQLVGSFDGAMTRAMLVMAIFFAMVLVGYRLPVSRQLAERASRWGTGMQALDVRWVIGAFLVIGLMGEALIFGKLGGLGTAFRQLGTQGNLAVEFTYLVILNFYTAALVLWACFHPPTHSRAKVGLGIAVAQLAVFYALLGSRTLVLIPILLMLLAWNETHKPIRPRVLVATATAAILFSSAYLSVRESSRTESFGSVIVNVPKYAVDFRAILSSSPVYDQLFVAVEHVPERSGYRYGGEFGQGLLGTVPRVVYPGKPESTDVSFRKLIWGDRFLAGRPISAAGEFYRDFGWIGVVVGSLLFGVVTRVLTGLRARAGPADGRALRAAVFVVGLVLLYQFAIGSWSILFGSGLAIGIPLFLALRVFARPG